MNAYIAPGLETNLDQVKVKVNMDMVVELVCTKMKITRQVLTTKTRQREILVPRQVAMAFTKEFVPYLSLSYIGEKLGDYDHATVLHAKKTVNETWMHDKVCGYGPVVMEIHEELLEVSGRKRRH